MENLNVQELPHKSTESYKNGEYWQAILDVSYYEWQRRSAAIQYEIVKYQWDKEKKEVVFTGTRKECEEFWSSASDEEKKTFSSQKLESDSNKENDWGYSQMIDWTQETFGDEFALLILLGKYNQQVGNGGHVQYWDNGYASYHTGGVFSDHEEMGLHALMIELFEKYKYDDSETGKRILKILKSFFVDIDHERYIEEEFYDEDEQEYYTESVENYEYGSVLNYHQLEKLDDQYYKEEIWEKIVGEKAKKLIF